MISKWANVWRSCQAYAYAEYDIAARDCVVPLPEELDDEPFPGEPLACAMNIFERSDIHHGQSVDRISVGALGARQGEEEHRAAL